jgi:hypothetical protein
VSADETGCKRSSQQYILTAKLYFTAVPPYRSPLFQLSALFVVSSYEPQA